MSDKENVSDSEYSENTKESQPSSRSSNFSTAAKLLVNCTIEHAIMKLNENDEVEKTGDLVKYSEELVEKILNKSKLICRQIISRESEKIDNTELKSIMEIITVSEQIVEDILNRSKLICSKMLDIEEMDVEHVGDNEKRLVNFVSNMIEEVLKSSQQILLGESDRIQMKDHKTDDLISFAIEIIDSVLNTSGKICCKLLGIEEVEIVKKTDSTKLDREVSTELKSVSSQPVSRKLDSEIGDKLRSDKDPVITIPLYESETVFREYDITDKEAFDLVDRALNNAIRTLIHESRQNMMSSEQELSEEVMKMQQRPHLAEVEATVPNIEWPEIRKFTEYVGKSKIQEFILTWTLGNDWLYCIDYLGLLETRFDKRHRYKVRFSIPTIGQPIPRASASVYFTIVVSKIKPPHYKVDVLYVLESNHLIHKPGEYIFCDLWLRRIIDHKHSIMKLVDF